MPSRRLSGLHPRALSSYGWAAVSFTLALTCAAAWAFNLLR